MKSKVKVKFREGELETSRVLFDRACGEDVEILVRMEPFRDHLGMRNKSAMLFAKVQTEDWRKEERLI